MKIYWASLYHARLLKVQWCEKQMDHLMKLYHCYCSALEVNSLDSCSWVEPICHSIARCDRVVIHCCGSQGKVKVITAVYLVFCDIITDSLYTHYVALSMKGQASKAKLAREWPNTHVNNKAFSETLTRTNIYIQT